MDKQFITTELATKLKAYGFDVVMLASPSHISEEGNSISALSRKSQHELKIPDAGWDEEFLYELKDELATLVANELLHDYKKSSNIRLYLYTAELSIYREPARFGTFAGVIIRFNVEESVSKTDDRVVHIKPSVLKRLSDNEDWLDALEAAGVDNWDGYDLAKDIHNFNGI